MIAIIITQQWQYQSHSNGNNDNNDNDSDNDEKQVTAVGRSLFITLDELVRQPLSVPSLAGQPNNNNDTSIT